MGKMENSGIWEQIQKSVQETERLMGQKKYNLSMIKARQTMEFMVKLHCDKAGIVESTPEDMIHDLYEGKWISKSTAEHYMQILELGNKATKDGDNSPYNANQAFHVLTQEIYAFVDADKVKHRRSSTAKQSVQAAQTAGSGSTRKRQTATSAAASATSSSRVSRSTGSSKRAKKSSGFNQKDLLKLLIPIALVIVLIFLIKVLTPEKDPTAETTPATQITVEKQSDAIETTPAETESALEANITYKTTTTLNVRSAPSTEAERVGKLDPDKTVEYIRDHDDFWAVILYNGQEAYVAKEYLTPVTE
ncbi:MAG: SH3 domain-containing protein [Lachnospiraceae bacterium]|nr:SH3 domain-containing protein [Lachnospiraceae bacterium]